MTGWELGCLIVNCGLFFLMRLEHRYELRLAQEREDIRVAQTLNAMGAMICREAKGALRANRNAEAMRLLALSDMCKDEKRLRKDAFPEREMEKTP